MDTRGDLGYSAVLSRTRPSIKRYCRSARGAMKGTQRVQWGRVTHWRSPSGVSAGLGSPAEYDGASLLEGVLRPEAFSGVLKGSRGNPTGTLGALKEYSLGTPRVILGEEGVLN